MTATEVAALLQVKPATLRQWRKRGTGPSFHQAGRVVRYHPTAVGAWMRACERRGEANTDART
jgi:predicted site-specific integrase-resolvase